MQNHTWQVQKIFLHFWFLSIGNAHTHKKEYSKCKGLQICTECVLSVWDRCIVCYLSQFSVNGCLCLIVEDLGCHVLLGTVFSFPVFIGMFCNRHMQVVLGQVLVRLF